MKRLIAIAAIAIFSAGSLFAQNDKPVNPPGKVAPSVAEDKGKGKDNGKHIGEDKEHHHHHHRHHEHKPGDKK